MSRVSLSRGTGDTKRGGFGLTRRHGAVNSEGAVVFTDCKRFAEREAVAEDMGTVAGPDPARLYTQVGLTGSRLGAVPWFTEQAVCVS